MMQLFDYIVVGGGSGGCPVARRLVDAGHSVCLLEAGSKGRSPFIHIPIGMAVTLPTRHANWAFQSVPQVGLDGRRSYAPRGKALGGSSSINAMLYTRGHPGDYDEWEALGNPGWAYKDVLPFFKKAEHNQDFDNEFHGQDGPLNVTHLETPLGFNQHFIKDAEALQIRHNADFNGKSQEGVGLFQTTTLGGQRCSAAKAYLKPIAGHEKLTVITRAHTTRLIMDGTVCKGAEFSRKGTFQQVFARKDVILSAGAFCTPQILMLSGIGPREHLESHGINVIHDLPGVGQNLQEHPDYISIHKSKNPELVDISLRGALRMARDGFRYLFNRRGLMASVGAESGGFLRTDQALDRPDIQLHFVIGIIDDHNRKRHAGSGFSCHICVLRPKSRGCVTLGSANPLEPPVIDPALLKEQDDINTLVKGYRLMQKILRGPNLSAQSVQDVYDEGLDTDAEIEAIIRARADNVYHPVGTAKMGTDDMAVVAPENLKVHGIEGLRISDASIMPRLIGGNTNAPTIMIGERCADMILSGYLD